jgi:YfiH family protein
VLPDPFYDHDGQIAIDLPGARAVFTTRSWGDVRESRSKIAERLGLELASATQVHGATVITVSASTGQHQATLGEADAIVTTVGGVAPMVLAADCVPIVIAAPGAVAAVHAGWRGLDAGVIAVAAARVRMLSGGVLNAAIGPAAGACCYEVGEDLHRRFALRSQDFSRRQNLDLKAIARVQLMEAGVARVHDCDLCTICGDPALTFSYRREGAATGRQAAIAWLS